jgi:hypothetical protein
VGGLGGDGVLFAFPLEDAGVVDAVGEVFVGFELLEGSSGLAGDFLLAMSLSAMVVYFFLLVLWKTSEPKNTPDDPVARGH